MGTPTSASDVAALVFLQALDYHVSYSTTNYSSPQASRRVRESTQFFPLSPQLAFTTIGQHQPRPHLVKYALQSTTPCEQKHVRKTQTILKSCCTDRARLSHRDNLQHIEKLNSHFVTLQERMTGFQDHHKTHWQFVTQTYNIFKFEMHVCFVSEFCYLPLIICNLDMKLTREQCLLQSAESLSQILVHNLV